MRDDRPTPEVSPRPSLAAELTQRPFISGTVFALLLTVVVFGLLYVLRGVLTPIFTALAIAYLLDPVVDRLEEKRIPRGVGITIVLTSLALLSTGFLLLVLPGVIREVAQFLGDLPNELAQLLDQAEPILARYDIPVPHTLDEALSQFELAPAEVAERAAEPLQAIVRSVLGGTVSVVGSVASALIVPVLAFYLLYDFDRMVEGARELVPPRVRGPVVEVASEIDAMLGQFVRGQLLVMIAMAVLYGGAYSLVGVRLAVPIALVAGVLAFIPYVGSGSALAMALLMCVVDWDGWGKVVGVVVAYAVCQFLEGFVIVPRVVGNKVGLPAVWVLVALMIGGELFGFLGVLLAVPAAAVVKIFVVRGVDWYKKSAYYLGIGARIAPAIAGIDGELREHLSSPPARPATPPSPAASATSERSAESTAKPAESTAKPEESTAKPAESTAKPAESNAKPAESTAPESTAKPAESTAPESTAKPAEDGATAAPTDDAKDAASSAREP